MRRFDTSVSKLIAVFTILTVVRAETTSAPLFDWEQIQLTENNIFPSSNNGTFSCKAFPGTSQWPSDQTWNALNETLHGTLLKPAPLASVCYNNTVYNNYDASQCETVSASWTSIQDRLGPIEVGSLLFEGLTCIPPDSLDTNGCTQGGYPVYVANVSTVADIQAAVNFARSTNVRLIVKNTGHDFSGKSLGGGSLSIWTHHLKDIVFYDNYVTEGYSGPAFKVGSGVQGIDIYQAASEQGLIIVGGICDSVGLYGGYSQGGGHSMIGSLHGMGADQILSIQVVTADGSFITASPTSNTDIFWAIRGGGGSTFGVVTSMVVKAFKDIQTTATTLSWGVEENNITADTFWKGISSYFSYFENFTSYGTSAEWFLFGSTDPNNTNTPAIEFMGPLAPGKSLEETQSIFNPWIADMTALGIKLSLNWTYYSSYHTAYYVYFPTITQFLEPYNGGYSSRLVPRENFDKNKKLNLTVEVYRDLAEGGYFMNGYHYAPTLSAGAPVGPDNPPDAVNPAWRNALSHTIVFVSWPQNATVAQQWEIRENFANVVMKPMRDATPGAGSYMNEGDILEPDFQQSFYGSNYPRLLQIKRKYDPGDVFWAITAVGSEGWAVRSVDGLPTENGPLCRVG